MKDLLPWITGSGGALVVLAIVCWLFYSGQLHSAHEFSKLEQENDALRAALDDERKTADGAVRSGTVTNQLISALVAVATRNQSMPEQREVKDLTEELGA